MFSVKEYHYLTLSGKDHTETNSSIMWPNKEDTWLHLYKPDEEGSIKYTALMAKGSYVITNTKTYNFFK